MILGQTPADRKKMPAKTADGRPTVALALGGGGARGAAHIGILRVFQEEGIPIDYIVGNSMGAIVGGLYCAGTSLNDITDCLENGSLQHAYMPSSLPIKILTSSASKMLHPFSSKHYAGLWSGKKLTRYLDNVLPRPNMDVSETQIPFSAVATNLLDGKAYRISSGRLSTAIKASSAISPLIQPVALNDKVYVDGGVRANLPASAARDTGAGVVIAVLIDEPLQKVPAKRFRHLKNIGSRMADIVLAIADERQLQFADIVINPDVSGISILSKKSSDAEKAIHAGELAARQALPGLRQKLGLSTVTASSSAKSIHTIQNSRLE
jgi:NTE family protein